MAAAGRMLSVGFAAVLLGLGAPAATLAGGDSIAPFFGTYHGHSIAEPDPGVRVRDLDVQIAPADGGFRVTWTTAMRDRDEEPREKTYSIEFEPAGRSGIYGSRMRTDMFGNRVPNDPLRGAPYVWARLQAGTLSVFALLITDDGGYEMQVYHRTLVQGGLALRFLRLREGEAVRTVRATLSRVAP